MSIIRTVLNEYQLTGNIADFLQQLQTKAQTVPPEKDGVQYCRIDELYGFMPPAVKKRSEKPSVSTSWTAS